MVLVLHCSDVGHRGPLLETGLGAGHDGERLVAGPIAPHLSACILEFTLMNERIAFLCRWLWG